MTERVMSGDDLRAWRKAMRLTQTEAGERLGLSKRQMVKLEAGEDHIKRSIALACAALKIAAELRDLADEHSEEWRIRRPLRQFADRLEAGEP